MFSVINYFVGDAKPALGPLLVYRNLEDSHWNYDPMKFLVLQLI
jgi:hypothetical protein